MVTSDESATPTSTGSWVPFAMAARYLGVSERTLRRHVARGTQQAHRVDGRVEVYVRHGADERDPVHLDAAKGQLEAAAAVSLTHALAALREALTSERERADRAEVWLHEAQEQRVQLAQEVARLRIESDALRASLDTHAHGAERAPDGNQESGRTAGRSA